MNDKVNLAGKLATFDEPFQPKIVGYYNDNKVMVGKIDGEFVWHSHPDTDDFFLVVSGRLTMQLREGDSSSDRGISTSCREGSSIVPGRTRAPRSS